MKYWLSLVLALALAVTAMAGAVGAAPVAVTTGSTPQGHAATVVGIVDHPCAYESSVKASHHGGSWVEWFRTHDFGQLCYYHDANARLPAIPPHGPRVVFLGDSITEIWKQRDRAFFTDGRIDRGISGQTTSQMLLRFRQDVIDLHPAVVHIMGGINDIAGNTGPVSLARIEGNLADMAELAHAHGIKVILASVLPAGDIPWNQSIHPGPAIIALNRWLRSYARAHGCVYANYHDAMVAPDGAMRSGLSVDGVHPTAKGFALMDPIAIKAIRAALRKGNDQASRPASLPAASGL